MFGGLHKPVLVLGVSAVSVAAFLTAPTASAFGNAPPPTRAVVDSPSLQRQLAAVDAEKAGRTPVQRKIDSQLLYAEKHARHVPFPAHFPKLQTGITTDTRGDLAVDVSTRMTPGVLSAVRAAGGRLVLRSTEPGSLRVRLPLVNVEKLAASPDVTWVAPAERPMLAAGSVASEGDTTHRAAAARAAFGVNGAGVKVGVLSDGVDSLAASQASGDLGPVTVLPGQAGSGDEGTAMLEIVHDVAPGAQLYFATAFNSDASFAANIRALEAAGCDIIVDDVFYYSEGAFQDDTIAQAVNDVTADGALYFSSAGNSGNLDDNTSGNWEGDFVGYTDSSARVWADFNPGTGVQNANPVALVPSTHAATLQWADPLAGSSNDYDLYLVSATGTILATSTGFQNGTQDPYERVDVAGSYSGGTAGRMLMVRQYSGQARFMDLNLNRGYWAPYSPFAAYATAGMTTGHSAAADAFSVAATPAHLAFAAGQPVGPYPNPFHSDNVSETFTSDGPRHMFYAADGTPYTPGNFTSTGGIIRQKPDLTAADGVATTVPGFQPFYGTSAAAPHAGAIAALLLDAAPGITPAQVRAALTSTAIDIEAPGWDRDTGAGIIDAYAATQDVAANPSSLTIQAPASVDYHATFAIRTTLSDGATHEPLDSMPVSLYGRAKAGTAWSLVKTVTTSSTGGAAATLRLAASGQFQWRFAGAESHQSVTSATKAIAVKQVVSISQTRATIAHGSTVKFYGTVLPSGKGQTIYLQQRTGTTWVQKAVATIKLQKLPDGTTKVGYLFKVPLGKRGTFTFRAYKPATASLAAGFSRTASVKVT